MQWFSGRTILITGASSGIGSAIARTLGPKKANILLTARSEEALEGLAEALRLEGSTAHVYPLDLASPGAADRLHEQIVADGHQVDILVNNAGYGKMGLFQQYDVETYSDMITLNVTNLVALTRHVVPGMIERGRGGVLNIASTASFQPVPRLAVYAATKAFVKEFSQALHAELASSGIHVTCLAPGPTDTLFLKRANQRKPPGGRPMASAEDVASTGLEALARNKRLVVYGLLNRIAAFGTRFAPTVVTLAAGRKVMEAAE